MPEAVAARLLSAGESFVALKSKTPGPAFDRAKTSKAVNAYRQFVTKGFIMVDGIRVDVDKTGPEAKGLKSAYYAFFDAAVDTTVGKSLISEGLDPQEAKMHIIFMLLSGRLTALAKNTAREVRKLVPNMPVPPNDRSAERHGRIAFQQAQLAFWRDLAATDPTAYTAAHEAAKPFWDLLQAITPEDLDLDPQTKSVRDALYFNGIRTQGPYAPLADVLGALHAADSF